MPIPGRLQTTAMAVMPHTDVDRALETAMSLDIPFWPQLPNYSYYEDMYVQAAEHFPGILLDVSNKKIRFSMDKFIRELEETMSHFKERNPNAFMFVDEPGLQFLFSAMSGYGDLKAKEDTSSMLLRLENVWNILESRGIDKLAMLEKSLLSPATCCLVNPDKEKTVEKAFQAVKRLSAELRSRYHLSD